ncbi:MAG: efflux RND transporter periplasmic adaptor subunit [Candidatus Omnitrophica bacterium]|jgi:macrolide-specific efflux system membrane fusion protein|nr:efflux RND transporter periplasmic adaptor subunit [Candidatus Omnitrophota bacterium]
MIKKKFILIILLVLVGVAIGFFKFRAKSVVEDTSQEITPSTGTIQNIISTTGTVLPKNRLEIKPPVAGRIESISVKEGEEVKIGQILASMSSTERAALLDAARGQGQDALRYWEEAYKPITLLAPIDGEVIVATTQPGQTVTTSDDVIVLSDHLIVRAQVDETDIGKIKVSQDANIILDAYPDIKIKAKVEHIYYESETVNNVTIYKVDLIPESAPEFFRSGMNATVDFTILNIENALLIPVAAVHKDKNENYVLLKQAGSVNPVKRVVELGVTDDKNYEVISGVTANDTIIITTKKYVFPSNNNTGSNPFLPKMPSHKKEKNNQ